LGQKRDQRLVHAANGAVLLLAYHLNRWRTVQISGPINTLAVQRSTAESVNSVGSLIHGKKQGLRCA